MSDVSDGRFSGTGSFFVFSLIQDGYLVARYWLTIIFLSHSDEEVLRPCVENEIDFVCLVLNSTHLTQSLDVAFFRPIKPPWPQTLMNWKEQHSKAAKVPYNTFFSSFKNNPEKMNEVAPKTKIPLELHQLRSGTQINKQILCKWNIYI